jgi:CheY-like chemotaxis protein
MAARKTILVVDDDEAIRETLCELLVQEGYEVLCAENGLSAMELLADKKPSMVLLDLMMPVMSGWEVLEALEEQEHLSHIPVVVVSAMGPPQGKPFLPKPIDLDRLLTLVHEYCTA